ncbi:hypothetical protein EDB92DRAFT_1148637, partial [Lactarius akahatsu]
AVSETTVQAIKRKRRTTSTAFQVATDHAFTGTYSARFRQSDPPESRTCPCGAPSRSSEHVIFHCPRFIQPRLSLGLLSAAFCPVHPPIQYSSLFTTRDATVKLLLKFLQQTRALSRPESGPPRSATRARLT